jgi:hypothetical protein
MNTQKLNRAIKSTRAFNEWSISQEKGYRKLPVEVANKIYDVLVHHCGARDEEITTKSGETYNPYRSDFVYEFSEIDEPTREWRFCGDLGFGGKFWWNGKFYVSCYAEDETPEIKKAIEKANEELWNIFEEYVNKLLEDGK